MSDVAGVKERVQTFLTSLGPVQIDSDGDYVLMAGSTRTYVRIVAHNNNEATIVSVFAPILYDVPLTPELYKYVALHANDYIFGHLSLREDDGGMTGRVTMTHKLLGDYLDKEELFYAAFGIAGVADEIDDEMKTLFGGRRLVEE
jgi:hypothetical protein